MTSHLSRLRKTVRNAGDVMIVEGLGLEDSASELHDTSRRLEEKRTSIDEDLRKVYARKEHLEGEIAEKRHAITILEVLHRARIDGTPDQVGVASLDESVWPEQGLVTARGPNAEA